MIRFTCGDTKILSNIRMSQNILTRLVVAKIQLKISKGRVLGTEEPCTCEYVTLQLLFYRGSLSID